MKVQLTERLADRLAEQPSSRARLHAFAAARALTNLTGDLASLALAAAVVALDHNLPAMAGIGVAVLLRPFLPSSRLDDVLRKMAGLPDGTAMRRARRTEFAIRGLTLLAGILAGRKYAHLPQAWAADLCGNPEAGELPPLGQRLRLSAGFAAAALRCRLDDAADLAWKPVDALVSSWNGSNLAVLMPVTIAVGLILPREGFYGLIANAENLGVIAVAPYGAIKGIRKYRQIDTPKRPEKKRADDKAPVGDGPGRRQE
jgi:hypothetical protein